MPKWDPTAKALLELNKKTRHAARLLTEQVRREAALLQFERDALVEAGGDKNWSCHECGWLERIRNRNSYRTSSLAATGIGD
jgi:hypothetical protein